MANIDKIRDGSKQEEYSNGGQQTMKFVTKAMEAKA